MPRPKARKVEEADVVLSGQFADVIVDRTVAELQRPLTYAIPLDIVDQISVGCLVRVPLRQSEALGYVIGVKSTAEGDFKIRPLSGVYAREPIWGPDLMGLATWMADFYHAFLSQCLQSVVPAPVRMENQRRKGTAREEQPRLEAVRPPPPLLPRQVEVLDVLRSQLQAGKPAVSLLHGVTGSGKTEVYLHAIEETLKLGRQAIVLVPEISLTAQAIDRYTARFGDRVAVMHSGLTPAERLGEWWRLRRGEADIALGARSAVFAPVPRLGLIVVDEEQDASYKQNDRPPRYHARQVAIKRATDVGAVVVLGSATPSFESYYWGQQGRYVYLPMTDRVSQHGMPAVEILDMRSPKAGQRFGVFSEYLLRRIERVLQGDGQVLLFLNRRGFSAFLLCEACGHIPQCPSCDITLTYHLQGVLLRCHYCLYEEKLPPACPKCGHQPFKHQGTGTQRVEDDIVRYFPDVPLVRMDADTTSHKNAHRTLLGEFASGKARILLGTQMIAKGLDFPQVRLVAVISADTALGMPDFRAAERAFALLTQVAGRAGRSEWGGEVILQTYNPDHPAIQRACEHDYAGFYAWDIANRQELRYPPYTHIVNVLFSGEDETLVRDTAQGLFRDVRDSGLDLLGPAPCPLSKVRNRYRWHLLARGPRVQEIVRVLRTHVEAYQSDRCQVSLDVDPVQLM